MCSKFNLVIVYHLEAIQLNKNNRKKQKKLK